MLISKEVYVTWNSRNKKYYTNLGYTFTKMGDKFLVKTEDLTKGSQAIVKIKCDYCGEEFECKWDTFNRLKKKDIILTDCCGNKDCTSQKAQEVIMAKYHVNNCREIEEVNEKIKKTNLKKYGVENPFGNKDIQEKIKKTNLELYGYEVPSKNEYIRNKIRESDKKYYEEHPEAKLIGEKSPRWKSDTEYERAERATHEYYEWRKNVFIRDGFTCQKCNRKSHKNNPLTINAHHIKNWKDNISDRYDTENGITLCQECHNKFHSIYGKRNNTQQQLIEFLNS